jgi:single-stranded DNA-specific DHH superfamily exonuclease
MRYLPRKRRQHLPVENVSRRRRRARLYRKNVRCRYLQQARRRGQEQAFVSVARIEGQRNGDIVSVSAKEYWKLRVERLSAAGLCIHCGKKPRTETTKRCADCKNRTAKYSRRHYEKTKDKAFKMRGGEHGEGATFAQIGLALGISRTRVEQIYERAILKLHRECTKRGLDANLILGRGFSMIALAERWGDE